MLFLLTKTKARYSLQPDKGEHHEKNKCIDDTPEDTANVLEP